MGLVQMLLFKAAIAQGLTCHQIVDMVHIGVPVNVILEAVESSATIQSDDIECLMNSSVPRAIVAAAGGDVVVRTPRKKHGRRSNQQR